jgi:hypothetical protein
MRTRVAAAACFAVLAAVAIAQQFPLRQNVEVLTEAPMRPVKVKDGLYIIRGPAMPCMTGCRPGDKGDGLIHESGDVAVRVTTDGLIVVDDKFASQAADVFAQVKKVSPLPVKYVLNTHHHADHASGNQYARDTFGVNIIAQKNIARTSSESSSRASRTSRSGTRPRSTSAVSRSGCTGLAGPTPTATPSSSFRT